VAVWRPLGWSTLSLAGALGGLTYLLVNSLRGYFGVIAGFLMLAAVSLAIWLRSRKTRVDQRNINNEWRGRMTTGLGCAQSTGDSYQLFTRGLRCIARPVSCRMAWISLS
jgi:hypothetical protein